MIALREDFLANLEDLSNEIPAILHNRFRLGPLNAKAARDAIIMPAGLVGDAFDTTRFSYQEAAVERIIAFLARRRTGAESMEEGEVEPVQMQLICHYLEEMVRARQVAQKGEAEIQITEADLGGEEQMRQVLEGFYDRTIASVRPRSKARSVRRLCEFRLISASGRRLTQDEEEIQRRYRISGELLRQLVDARLLRAEPRLGGTSYEVSHDRLVEPILQSRKKRAMRMRMFAAAAVPLFLAVTISQGWSTFERSHRETEIKAHLMEPNALSAIQSAGDLARRYSFDHTKLLEMAGPVLNPSAFAIFTRLPNDSWEWKEPSQARKILEHIRRTYPAFLNAPANTKEEAGANARVLLGAIVSTLDHAARTRPENDRPFANEVAELRADILEAYRKKFPPTGPNSCSSETSVVVYNENQILHRIQQNVVLRSLYEGCLEPRSETGKTADNPIPNQAKDLSDFFGYRVSWYEAAAYAALRGGKLPSKGDLDSAKGKINFEDGEEWLRDEKRNKISISGSAPRHPFRVVW